MSAAPRELARRLTGTLEVVLLWYADTDRLCVCVEDAGGGDHFQLEVTPAEAMDVFHHPFAYAATRRIQRCPHNRAEARRVDV